MYDSLTRREHATGKNNNNNNKQKKQKQKPAKKKIKKNKTLPNTHTHARTHARTHAHTHTRAKWENGFECRRRVMVIYHKCLSLKFSLCSAIQLNSRNPTSYFRSKFVPAHSKNRYRYGIVLLSFKTSNPSAQSTASKKKNERKRE